MDLPPLQQAVELLNRSKTVLVCLPVRPSSDAIAAGLALFLTLGKLGKRARVICHEFELPSNHTFLPKSDAIERELKNLRQFVINLDVSRVAVDELSYTIENGRLSIFITPRDGFYEARDVTTNAGTYAFDAIVVLDASDLDQLGGLATSNAEFFYRTPVLNIDHRAANTRFGAINLVDLTASSTSEIVFELTKGLGFNVLDEQVATTLLTGIISKTKSFQTPTVTPRSLAVASHLIASGARREEIIDNLYQSKSVATLKLWGRALARVQERHDGRLIWSLLNEADFQKSGASDQDLPRVIDELMVNVPTAELIIVLYERTSQGITALISSGGHDRRAAFPGSRPLGTQNLLTWRPEAKDLPAAEREVLAIADRLFGDR